MKDSMLYQKTLGCLIGGLIGDAMGAPTENKTYQEIEEKFGEVREFESSGTDDTLVKMILCDAIISHDGYVTADEFAEAFLKAGPENRSFYGHGMLHNMYGKLYKKLVLPVYAGLGNHQTSHSCMMISPMGIINACNPRQAAIEAFEVAGLIHAGVSGVARDVACAVAAAVAEAMRQDSSIESIIEASYRYLHRVSAGHMIERIQVAVNAAKMFGEYKAFRKWYYENNLSGSSNDPDETVPCALACVFLAEGRPDEAIIYGANFGRDADTIATMAGSVAGAYAGISAFPGEWIAKLDSHMAEQMELAERLVMVTRRRFEQLENDIKDFKKLL